VALLALGASVTAQSAGVAQIAKTGRVDR